LRAFTCSTTELRTCVRKESNLRPCAHEVTALFTTGRGTRSGNRRLLRPRPAGHPVGREVLYPLSYRRTERRAGFEPATSRFADEVTAIFTTDRVTVGGDQAMLLPLRRAVTELRHSCRRDLNHATSEPQSGRCSTEVTGIFTTAMPKRIAAPRQSKRHAGEQAISVSMTPTQALPRGRTGARDAAALARPLPRYVTSKAGFEPAFPMVRSIRNLHHQRSLSRKMRRTKIEKQILSRRSQRRAAIANPFLVRSAIGVRLAPRSLRQAPRFGRAPSCASPGIRVSRSGFSRRNFEGPCSGK